MADSGPLHVFVDARCLNTAHLRGMGKYVSEMMSHVDALEPVRWTCCADRPELPFQLPALRDATIDSFDHRGYRFSLWEQLGLPRRVRTAKPHVLHATMTTLPWWQPAPTVVTVHDTLPWEQPSASPYERWYWHQLIPAALHRAQAIVTISDCSARDILARWPGLESRLHVIRHGVSDLYLQDNIPARPGSVGRLVGERPYLLYVGGSAPHKRFSWALEVLQRLDRPGLPLLALGFGDAEAAAQRANLPARIAERVFFLPFVPEHDMPGVYHHATAMLYPTSYEGFGFPAIEAQASGTPALFSAAGSLSELVGPLSTVLPPDDLDAWTTTIRSLPAAAQRPTQAARDGARWAAAFSWEQSARRHLQVYRHAAGLAPPDRA